MYFKLMMNIFLQVQGSIIFDSRMVLNVGNLTIYGLTKSDHGVYECEASNEVRKIITSTEIIIQSKCTCL